MRAHVRRKLCAEPFFRTCIRPELKLSARRFVVQVGLEPTLRIMRHICAAPALLDDCGIMIASSLEEVLR